MDQPQEQLRAIILPPDPLPIWNSRPPNYDQAEIDWIIGQNRSIISGLNGSSLIKNMGAYVPPPPAPVQPPFNAPVVIPPGVTLRDIDGGPNYYAANGLTYAHNRGWDDPTFFPIGVWACNMTTVDDANRWAQLGWNLANTPVNINQSVIQNAGISMFINEQNYGVAAWPYWLSYGITPGVETVAIQTWDEPNDSTSFYNGMSTRDNSIQDGRFWVVNNTINWISFGSPSGQGNQGAWLAAEQLTPNSTTRHINMSSLDMYPFSGVDIYTPQQILETWMGGYDPTIVVTDDLRRRGFYYGDIIDAQRAMQIIRTPLVGVVENGGPTPANTTAESYIQPQELNWAVWQSIIHGARGIEYFNHSFAGPGISDDNMATDYFHSPQAGASISMFDQSCATDLLVKQMAPVINAPFADHYATVDPPSPAPVPLPATLAAVAAIYTGIDLCVHIYQGGFLLNHNMPLYNGAYIFASTRMSPAATNISATFTLAETNATSVVVINESGRTIPVTNGVFTDTFATAASIKIYLVNVARVPAS